MRLRLKEGKEITTQYGIVITNAVIEVIEERTDRYKTKTYYLGVFEGSVFNPMEKVEPVKVIPWEFSLAPKLPVYDSSGNLTEPGHSGAVAVSRMMEHMKIEEDGSVSIIAPKDRSTQLAILSRPYDKQNKMGDLWEFEGGLFPDESISDLEVHDGLTDENIE